MNQNPIIKKLKEEPQKSLYTSHGLIPGSISAENSDSMMNVFLQGFTKHEKEEDEVNFLVDNIKKNCFMNRMVKDDKNKTALLSQWIKQDLCYSTAQKKGDLHILPLCLNVSYFFPWKGKEPYNKIFSLLLRAGRKSQNLNLDTPLNYIFKCFAEGADDPESSIIMAGLKQFEENKDWKQDGNSDYEDNILCLPHCRVMQEDIENIFQWKIPRKLRLDYIKKIMLYHFCTLLVRMSFFVKDLVFSAENLIKCHQSSEIKCISCIKQYTSAPDSYGDLARDCPFNPGFSLHEESQRWYEALTKYHFNIALLKVLKRESGNSDLKFSRILKSRAEFLDFFNILKKNKARFEELGNLLDELKKYLEEKPPTAHAWQFFSRYAINELSTKFAGKHIRGSFKVRLSDPLLLSWSHIFVSSCESLGTTPLFLDFLDFLDTRGVKCEGNDLIELEKELHLQGLMKDYTDMGGAREIEPTLPRNE